MGAGRMTDDMLNEKIKALRQIKRAAEELQHNISAIESEIKAEMEARDVEQLTTKDHTVTWKKVTSVRLDAKALKAERPEIYTRYAVTSETRRFFFSLKAQAPVGSLPQGPVPFAVFGSCKPKPHVNQTPP